jgi:N-acetylglutamate synthase-like GNAT family acetyltransferase
MHQHYSGADAFLVPVVEVQLLIHAPGAPGMRWLGLGPGLKPTRSLFKLQRLLNQHAFWASGRSLAGLRTMLRESNVIVSLWREKRLIGFARATSDGIYRGVLWDVVIPEDLQGQGLGRRIVDAIVKSKQLRSVERIYLMTTNGEGFYKQLGFETETNQILMKRLQQLD